MAGDNDANNDINRVDDEEKYSPIRRTIRKVILPLVQAIYDEDPSDVIVFCSQYFETLLRKREDGLKSETSEGPQLQGSSSEPLLSGGVGRSLRETSSWDGPPKGGTQNLDRADIESGIGDQPGRDQVKPPPEDNDQIDGKSGDANFALKDEEEVFESCRSQENKTAAMTKSVLPSAPPYEENNPNLGDKLDNSGECTHPPEIPTSVPRDSFSSTVGEDVKTSSKILSPNSSLGFIPQLNDYESERRESTVDQDKLPGELQDLTVKFCETFQNIAQKFNSAENNLNVEFQNATEISDIIQGRCQSESIREDENSVLDSKISIERTVEGKAHYNDNFRLVSDNNNNIITTRDRENNCKDESTDEIEEIASRKDDPIVDESRRKRWDEVNACLNRTFQHMDPRLLRTKRIFTGNRRNLSVRNIGEGGDVPSDGYHISQRYSFHGSGRNNGSTNNDNSSVVTKPASEIKISLEENESKTACDSDLMEAKSDSTLPCSWNKTNQLVDNLETKNYALKQLIETLDERNDDSKSIEACEDSSKDDTLYEIIVMKDSDKSMKDDLATCTLSDNKKTACEHDNMSTFRKDANEKTKLSSMKIAGSEINLSDEKILSDSNDQDPNKEETCTEDYVDAVEVHEETPNSDADCHPKGCFDQDLARNEINKTALYRKSERPEDSETESKDLPIKCHRVEDHSKVEPGLNSACGDFTLSRMRDNNEGDLNSRQAGLPNSQYRNLSGAGMQAITAEYVEEIMDRQQQNLNDSYEGLTFSESESSNIESDFSEADDTSFEQ